MDGLGNQAVCGNFSGSLWHKTSSKSIASPLQKVVIDGVLHKFPDTRPLDVKRPEGQVDILVGIDKLSLHPKSVLTAGDLSLHQSLFGTGWVLGELTPV